MTIPWFLATACLMMVLIALMSLINSRKKRIDDKDKRTWAWFSLLVILLGILSPMVVRKYIYPKDQHVFNNAEYHVLEHTGFNVCPPFHLINEEEIPIAALYDSKEGVVTLNRDNGGDITLDAKACYEPIYVTEPGKKKKAHLINRYFSTDVSEGFSISMADSVLYTMEIVPAGKGRRHYISSIPGHEHGDTSEFTREIGKGYMLYDIISNTPGLEIPEELRVILDGTMLVRETENDKTSDLVLMPNQWMSFNTELKVNGESVASDTVFKTVLGSGSLIHTGFGFRMTRALKVQPLDSTRISLRYKMPVRKKLRNSDSKLLITSSIDIATENTQDGIFLFNIFDEENNLNHINGTLHYGVDNSRTDMQFHVQDQKALSNYTRDTIIGSDTEFCLQTSGSHENAPCEWTFTIHNMRETNGLTYSRIVWLFVGLFLLLVCIRVVTDQWLTEKKGIKSSLSGFEIGTYIVLLAFGVTRLILAWRSSTFPPIEDIGINAYTEMRSNVLWWTILFCHSVPLLMTLWSAYTAFTPKNKKGILERLKLPNVKNHLYIICGYTAAILLLFLLRNIISARIAIIFLPLLAYFLVDFWFIQLLQTQETKKKKNWLAYRIKCLGWERPLVFIIATGVFFIGDAGFAVIFVIFSMVRLAVSVLTEDSDKLSRVWRVTGFTVILIATFIFILNEGALMSFAINNLAILLPVAIALLTGVIILALSRLNIKHKRNIVIAIAAIGLLATASSVAFPKMRDVVAKKGIHMKYRAAVQELEKDQDIGVLMTDCKFKSSDIMYIMRSAQNQWFLNQYLKAGEDLDGYFRLQPHSCQGSPYNTQTTDVVITRYVKAEHKGPVAELLIIMLLLLIVIYCNEVDVTGRPDGKSRGFLAMLIYLFVIAFSVYMSATNRTVFMGQDFPFISIQSKLAVILPAALLFLVAQHVMLIMGERKASYFYGKRNAVRQNGANDAVTPVLISFGLLFFALAGWEIVPSKGTEQRDSQFNVNKIINDVSVNVDRIDDAFAIYQEENRDRLKGHSLNDIWQSFTASSNDWKAVADTTHKGSRFIPSLMNDFSQRTDNEKCDPEELVHIRKRSNIYHLCVNKRFYFIERIIDSHYPWTGNLLAAETPLYFNFSNTNNPRVGRTQIRNHRDADYETNIIPDAQRARMSDVQIMRFDTSWSADRRPLILIKTIPNNEQYYDIESNNLVVHGRNSRVQMATRILENDLVTVNRKTGRTSTNILTWRYGQDNHRFLAKNIWINGRQKLFYPLGKESMWSYQFANLVNSVYGDADITDTSYRHRDLQVSIDYDLHKDFYRIIDKMNTGAITMSEAVRDNLADLINEPYAVKNGSRPSSYYLYFNVNENRFMPSGKVPAKHLKEVNRLTSIANKRLARMSRNNNIDSTMVNMAIRELLKRKYSYSAVVVDGNGRIRLLFDYNKRGQRIDPNNIEHYNKFLSDMYRDGSNELERDVLGNKTLQYLNPGPGSTFKPIVYTAITSTKKLNWNSINVSAAKPAEVIHKKKAGDKNSNEKYDWYGGVEAKKGGLGYFSIAGSAGYAHNDYIIQSNNFYHSVIVLLGMQRADRVEGIIGPAKSGAEGFPQFTYNGANHSFDPDLWFAGNESSITLGNSVMEEGLRDNFRLNIDYNTDKYEKYFNPYGTDSLFGIFYNQKRYPRQWCYPETGSLNRFLRQRMPWLREGFVQMVSGSAPLNVSPLQVASMAMRLATLNSADNITTLNDAVRQVPETMEFDVTTGGWSSNEEYFNFYKTQVLGQMRQVPYIGTARGLRPLAESLAKRGYYLYVKTGTLNIDSDSDKRIRNMMVIIANGELDKAQSLADLRRIRYYVMYMSYRDVDRSGFTNNNFRSQIEAVVNSELFNQYMQEGK